jgi:hypothetical protein
VSGFGNYNGVVRFFAGSTAQKLTSRQVVEELLNVGAEVHVVNRKRILHAKVYGASTPQGERLVTFEAENKLDFRLGTGPLRYTKVAKDGGFSPPHASGDRGHLDGARLHP